MEFNDIRKNGDLLFESIRGSHLFGLNTEDSDLDTFGVFCGPEDWFLGNGKDRVDMVKSEKSDDYWDELGKYFFELGKSNPEALTSLFTPEKFILHFDPILQPLWDIRDQLLTKQCFKSFSGYAYSQIKKAKGLNKAINTDPEKVKERKNLLYFCQVPVDIGTHSLKKWLEDRGLRQECCGISRLPNSNECYALFYDWGKARELGDDVCNDSPVIGYRGILSPNDPLTSQLRLSSIPKNEKPLCWFQFNSNAYTSHCIEYKRYWDWVKNRNQKRFELNTGHNYDCYSIALTKFLTDSGWKFYNRIDEGKDKIACFDKSGNIIFSKIKSKTEPHKADYIFNYEDIDNNIAFHVTLNHKLWLRREDKDEYELITVLDWIKQSTTDGYKFYQLRKLNLSENTNYSDEELELIGFLVANAAVVVTANEESIICNCLTDKMLYTLRKYLDNNVKVRLPENYYVTFDSDFIKKLIIEYGYLSGFLNQLSNRQLVIFMNGFNKLLLNDNPGIYKLFPKMNLSCCYSNSTNNNIEILKQEDISIRGWKGKIFYLDDKVTLMKYYEQNSQEVFMNPDLGEVIEYNIDDIRSTVICFESETGTLVTSGYFSNSSKKDDWGIALHGNSKNISHCVRIFTMATEIASGKGMILDRTGIDKDFLLSIKNHKLSYEHIIKYVEELRDKMEESFEKSSLPDSPDLDLLNKIMIKIRKQHYGRRNKY